MTRKSERPYAIGDRVVATRDICEGPDDDPSGLYAHLGDVLEVRKLGSMRAFAAYVAHPGDKPEKIFGVNVNEIRMAEPFTRLPENGITGGADRKG